MPRLAELVPALIAGWGASTSVGVSWTRPTPCVIGTSVRSAASQRPNGEEVPVTRHLDAARQIIRAPQDFRIARALRTCGDRYGQANRILSNEKLRPLALVPMWAVS